MRNINSREEANQYYKQVNELIESYIKTWNIRPTEIHAYFNRNMDSFLERNNLSDIIGIKRVVMDVLEHRRNMELDGVMKFESFNSLNENILNIGDSTIEHEKVLADFYNTSLGHVESIDSSIHLFKVNDFGKKIKAIIYSDDEMDLIKEEILNKSLMELEKKSIMLDKIDGLNLSNPLSFSISKIINQEKFREYFNESLSMNDILFIVKKIIQKNQDLPTNFSNERVLYKSFYSSQKKRKGYHIWEII